MAASNKSFLSKDTVIWLRQTDEIPIDNPQTQLQATVFDNTDECTDYIKQSHDARIVLIISGDNTQEIVSVVHALEQLKAVYVLNPSEEKNEDWTRQYAKVKGSFARIEQICAKVAYDLRLSDARISFDVFVNTNNESPVAPTADSLNVEFIYFHILIDILLKMSNEEDPSSKEEMVTYLRQKYQDDRIGCFTDENYARLSVYRGQSISNDDLNVFRQKQHGFFSMQSFLSTSTNLEVAHLFAGAGIPNTIPNEINILYEFQIDTRMSSTKPYARISHLSQIPDEEEILISLGAVFHIDSVAYDTVNQRWHAVLSLCDDQSFDLYEIMKQYAAEIVADRVSPGFLLYQQGKYLKAKDYFQQILALPSLKASEKAHCYRGLGAVAREEQNYEEGYKYFADELHIWQELDSIENKMEARKNMGDMLFTMGRFREALDYLQEAGLYFRSNGYLMEAARIYGLIGHIMGFNEQWDNCLMCYELQLKLREQMLEPNHEDIGITHANIGAAYLRMKKYKKAIEHLRKALDIYRHSFATDHPHVLKAQENLRKATCALNEGQ